MVSQVRPVHRSRTFGAQGRGPAITGISTRWQSRSAVISKGPLLSPMIQIDRRDRLRPPINSRRINGLFVAIGVTTVVIGAGWHDCVPGSTGPEGCDSIGRGGGLSIDSSALGKKCRLGQRVGLPSFEGGTRALVLPANAVKPVRVPSLLYDNPHSFSIGKSQPLEALSR
jgi:hypothetical protein